MVKLAKFLVYFGFYDFDQLLNLAKILLNLFDSEDGKENVKGTYV